MIRPYAEGDMDVLIAIWRAANELSHPFLSAAFLDTTQNVIRRVFVDLADTWIFEENGVRVGFVSLIENELSGLYVLPDYQGKGYGRAMLNMAVADRGALKLDVFGRNRSARVFYQKYGFQETGQRFDDLSGHHLIRMTYEP